MCISTIPPFLFLYSWCFHQWCIHISTITIRSILHKGIMLLPRWWSKLNSYSNILQTLCSYDMTHHICPWWIVGSIQVILSSQHTKNIIVISHWWDAATNEIVTYMKGKLHQKQPMLTCTNQDRQILVYFTKNNTIKNFYIKGRKGL